MTFVWNQVLVIPNVHLRRAAFLCGLFRLSLSGVDCGGTPPSGGSKRAFSTVRIAASQRELLMATRSAESPGTESLFQGISVAGSEPVI
jgi:hypothetical protein